MALQLPTAITFSTKLEGTGLDQLKRNLQGLAQQSNRTTKDLDQLYNASRKLSAAAGTSINSLNRQVQVLTTLRNEAALGSRQFKFYTAELEKLQRQQTKATGAGSGRGGVGGLLAMGGGLAGLAAAAGGTLAVKYVADVGMQAENAQVRLKALTGEFGEYNQAQEASARIAKTLRISNTEAQDSFASLYASLRPTGVTLAELEKAFIGFSAAARNSGATAQEASNALVQLKQGLASGVLQGDELRSIREQAPLVAQAIAKELKTNIGGLKNLAAEGKVTTDVVLTALGKLKETQLGKLNQQFDTGAQAVRDFQIATEKLGIQISKTFGPTAVKLVQAFTRLLERVSDLNSGGKETQSRLMAEMQAGSEAQRKFGKLGSLTNRTEFYDFMKQRTEAILEANRQAAAKERDKAQTLTPEQKQIQEDARKEREAARNAGAMEDAKKRLGEQLKIREDAEKRLADFREQSIQRAAQLERDLGDQRQELERSTAEARRRIQAQQQDFALEAERQKLRGAGLGTEALDTQARLNEATRRFTEQKIQIEQSATDRKVQIERTLADYQLSVARGISEILQDAADKMAKKMAAGGQAAAAAMTGAPMATGGIIARTGSTGQSTGPHLDARWADGRRITAADADRYLSVNGRAPSSYGVTSGYGPRSMFGRNFHAGMDFGTPSGSGITLKSGASVLRDLGFTGAGGYAVEIDTPEGRMRLLHLQAGSATARPVGRPGATAGAPGPVVGAVGVDAAGQRLEAAVGANRSVGLAAAAGDLVNSRQAELGTITSQLDQQRKSVREQREDFERMVELQRSGMSPELARQAVDRERAATSETASLQVLEQQLVKDLQSKDLTVEQRANVEAILKSTQDRLAAQPGIVQGLTEEERKLQQLQQAYEQKKQLVQGIADSIGSGISQALDLVINGTENWGDSLRSIAAGVLKDIARQLLQIMVIQPIVKGIAAGIGNLFPSANGNVFAPGGVVPYAMGGIVTRPTIFPFADGGGFRTGLMGEAGPEAIMPLKRGADGKLGVQIVNSNPQNIQAAKQPVAEAVLQPVVKSSIAAVKQPIAEALLQSVSKSSIAAAKQPVAEAVLQPVVKSSIAAVKQPIAEALLQSVSKSSIAAAKQPVAEAVLQPVVKSFIDAAKQPIAEAVLQPIVKSFIDAIKQPVAEAVLQPVIKSPVDAAKQPDAAMNTIRPFANGGIVDSPTLFKFANGGVMRDGLMGEAGPEAILPLKRGRGGKLGVAMQGEGGGSTNVTVNVDASGSQVQGDAGKGEQLGRVISQAVQAELIKQKRPGGLLTA
jgi:tape measure domain-containing protein